MAALERIQILNIEVDPTDVSEFRILVDGKSFKYLTIDPGLYDTDELVWDRKLIPLLPPLPDGDWNEGHIASHPDEGTPHFARHERVLLPTIRSVWHTTHIEWLDLQRGQKLKSNVYTASFLENANGATTMEDDLVIKFARFPWEMHYYEAETSYYRSVEGQGICPKFLGHLTEEQRVIGFVLKRIKDARHADQGDLEACQDVLRKLHRQGILHGDVNKHNFLVQDVEGQKTVTIIDLENASDCDDETAFQRELESLEEMLCSTDRGGSYYVLEDGEEE
jgi:Lipopolysaccharide kinase (Kdo/WaaP) family